jgi:hypothetical protein
MKYISINHGLMESVKNIISKEGSQKTVVAESEPNEQK